MDDRPQHWSGSATPAQLASSFGYQSDFTDYNSGSVWMQSRWYDPALRAFLSRDTFDQGFNGASALNRFAYGNANPLTNTDPSGHFVEPIPPVGPIGLPSGPILAPLAAPTVIGGAGEAVAADAIAGEVLLGGDLVVGGVFAPEIIAGAAVFAGLAFLGWLFYGQGKPSTQTLGPPVGLPGPPASPVPTVTTVKTVAPPQEKIDTTPDFTHAGQLMGTSSTAVGGVTTIAQPNGAGAFDECGVGSPTSCLLPGPNVITACASPTASMRPCLATPPQAGVPGKTGASMNAQPVEPSVVIPPSPFAGSQGGGSIGGGRPPASDAQPECSPEGQLPQDRNVDPNAPRALELERPVGSSASQNQYVQDLIAQLKSQGAEDFW